MEQEKTLLNFKEKKEFKKTEFLRILDKRFSDKGGFENNIEQILEIFILEAKENMPLKWNITIHADRENRASFRSISKTKLKQIMLHLLSLYFYMEKLNNINDRNNYMAETQKIINEIEDLRRR